MVDFINIELNKKDILYDNKVKTTKSSNGIIRLKKKLNEAYVIFPILRRKEDDMIVIAVDEIIKAKGKENDGKCHLDINRKYVGRKCVVINAEEPFSIQISQREVIKKDTVKRTFNGQGIIRIKDKYLGNRAYAIMPLKYEVRDREMFIVVDEIFNLGIHPDNDHISGVLFGQSYVGKECIVILQEG